MSANRRGATGPASLEIMHTLHRALAVAIKRTLKADAPTAEDMKNAASFVRDYGAEIPLEPSELRAIRRIRRSLLERLHEAISDPDSRPSASLLAVAHSVSASMERDAEASGGPRAFKAAPMLHSTLPFA